MVGKARSGERREHVVAENKSAGVAEVIRNVALQKLRVGEIVAIHIAVGPIAVDKVELIHPPAVDCKVRTDPIVADVAGESIGLANQRNGLTVGDDTSRRSVRSGECPEIAVEAAVLFDDEHNMLNE